MEFKVGDRVRVLDTPDLPRFVAGAYGTVIKVYSDKDISVEIDEEDIMVRPYDSRIYNFLKEDIALIEDVKKSTLWEECKKKVHLFNSLIKDINSLVYYGAPKEQLRNLCLALLRMEKSDILYEDLENFFECEM